MENSYGLSHFLAHLDPVGQATFAAMALLSISSWSVAVAKGFQLLSTFRAERRHTDRPFATNPSVPSPWTRIRDAGTTAALRIAAAAPDALIVLSQPESLVTAALGDALNKERQRLESGLALIATASSTAPFVGLFGTVWSIHRALVSIGSSGEGGLDKVAGPVGEALVMTGIGLAVAIPALLCYNALVSSQRGLLSRLDGFARSTFAHLATSSAGAASRDPAKLVLRETC